MNSFFEILLPDVSLSHIVKYYWILKDNGKDESTPELMIPDGYAEIIFNRISEPYERKDLHKASLTNYPDKSYVITSNGKSLLAKRINKIDMIGIKLSGFGLFRLLQIPLSKFSKEPIKIEDIGNTDLRLLEAMLFDINDDSYIKNILDRFFIGKIDQVHRNISFEAMKMIVQHKGCITIKSICKELKVSYSSLQREFDIFYGM